MKSNIFLYLAPMSLCLATAAEPPTQPHIHASLKNLTQAPQAQGRAGAPAPSLITRQGDLIRVQMTVEHPESALLSLGPLGFRLRVQEGALLVGDLPLASLDRLGTVATLTAVQPAFRTHALRAGKVLSQGDAAQRSTVARRVWGVSGKGAKIGIISDSYDALGGAAQGILDGELPGPGNPDGFRKPMELVADYALPDPTIDEGRALAEVVHDVAPAATLAFATGFTSTRAETAVNIRKLAKAGCQVIVDDTYFYDEPFFRESVITKAIQDVSAAGSFYVVSAGNDADSAFTDAFRPSATPQALATAAGEPLGNYVLHNFNARGTDHFQAITLQPGQFFFPWIQWNDRWQSEGDIPGAQADLDFFLATKEGDYGSILVRSSFQERGFDPVDCIMDGANFGYVNNTASEQTLYLLVGRKHAKPFATPHPALFRWMDFGGWGGMKIEHGTSANRTTIFGRSLAASALTVGAAYYAEVNLDREGGTLVEPFSSRGASRWPLVDAAGRTTLVTRYKPELVGPDGVNTSFFYPDWDVEGDGLPNFFGTSCSAPHVAGIAALMLEAGRFRLNPTQLKKLMIESTQDMDDPDTRGFDEGFDGRTGFGFLNAAKAVEAVKD